MLGSVVFAVVSVQATPPKVTYQDGSFVVSGALGSESVPVAGLDPLTGAAEKKADHFSLKVAGKTVSFNAKGLSISQAKGAPAVSRLTGVPTSGKIATKESNVELLRFIAGGKRRLEVSSLSGWEQIGDKLFLLVRWDDTNKKPWLETLMKVDLAQPRPKAELVGRFTGFSFAQGTVDDVLTLRTDKLSVLTDNGEDFGISRIPIKGNDVTFEALGQAVGKAKFSDDGSMAWTLTPTPYGTNILGIADLDYGTYHVVTEVRGKMTGVLTPAYARFKAPSGNKMINLMTGAEIDVLADSGQRQTSNGLLVWSPAVRPQQAYLFDPSFRRLAAWNAPPPIAPAVRVVAKRPGAKPVATKAPAKKPAVVKKSTAKTVAKKPVTKPKMVKKAAVKSPVVTIKSTKTPVKKPKSHNTKAAPQKG